MSKYFSTGLGYLKPMHVRTFIYNYIFGNPIVFIIKFTITCKHSVVNYTLWPCILYSNIVTVGNWHPDAVKKVCNKYFMELIKCLPIKDPIFMGLLRIHDLLPSDLQEEVEAKETRAKKIQCFWDNAIKPSIDIKTDKPLRQLLIVMKEDKYLKNSLLKRLATEIQKDIERETSYILSCKYI